MYHFTQPAFGLVAGVGFDRIVGGDVRCIVWIAVCGVETRKLVVDGAGFAEGTGKGRGMSFANCFTVPARAFGVEVLEGFLVGFAGPFESGGELCFFDFVVVIEIFAGLDDDVAVVGWRRELVRVPDEVNIESWDRDFIGVRADDGDETVVFSEDAGHCRVEGG